ncbi:MAG: hypothetical protein HXY40_03700 [Chloroflexi bacterium]|nr:hypothetical protein [Chloroflexota bacterium]
MNRATRIRNLAYAAIAALTGLICLVIVFTALFAGLWLDARFGVRGPFTIALLLLSVPLSVFSMLRVALWAVGKIQPQSEERH